MEIIRACLNDLKEMNDLWNEVSLENGFYKPIDFEQYQNKFLSYSDFSFDNVLLAKENNKLLGLTEVKGEGIMIKQPLNERSFDE